MDVLVVASTVPAHADDAVPRFVLDQALSLAEADQSLTVRVLAPHTPSSRILAWPRQESADGRVTQDRFHYAPARVEVLTARGIMPAISATPALTAVVPLLVAGEYRALRRAVKQRRPDVIYAHWFTPQAIVAASVARRAGVPFVFTTHASDVAVLRRLGPAGTGVVRRVTRRAAAVTAVSRQTAAKLLAFFDGTEREALERAIAVAPMGIDAQPDDQPNAHPDNPAARAGSHHTVAVIARLVEKKGIHVLLEAWPDVLATVPDARLLIGGDGPWRERLERQASGLAGVEFHGYVTGPAKVALEAQATLVAVPSVVAADGDSDGLPVAALEAWGRGAFVVASDASGAHELLEGAGIGEGTGVDSGAAPDPRSAAGVVVPAGDAAALASAIIDAMTRGEPARRRSAAAGRALAHSLTWQALAPAMLERLRAAARVGGWRP